MWKNILACSVLVLSGAVFVQSIATAQAQQGISFGQNPVFSKSGNGSGTYVISNVSGQEMSVTDVTMTANSNYALQVLLRTSSGVEIGRYRAENYNSYNAPQIDTHLISGLRVPQGEDLEIVVSGTGTYTVAGQYVHP